MANNTTRQQENLTIWQWNYRSLHNKHATLTQYIKTALVPPDVICLQEAGKQPRPIQGYYLYTDPDYPMVATLARKDLAITSAVAPGVEINHQILTIWPVKKGRPKCVLVNVYSPPRDQKADFSPLLHHVSTLLVRRDKLLLLGDFNAWHSEWGYKRHSKGLQSSEHITETRPLADHAAGRPHQGGQQCGSRYHT